VLTLRNAPNTYKYISAVMANEDFLKDDVFRLIKTRHEVQIVVDRDSMTKAKSFFPETVLLDTHKGIVEINIQLTPEGFHTPGVLSRMANELATQGINIHMIFSVDPAITIFLAEKDLLKAHDAIIRISSNPDT
jgi:aspartokinase